MTLGERLEQVWPQVFATKTAFAAAAGISKQYLNGLLKNEKADPSKDTRRGIATALGIDIGDLETENDERFFDAVEAAIRRVPKDPATNHEGPSRQASETRSGLVRSVPTDSGVLGDGRVVGPITYDAIKDPTGKGGKVLHLGHSRRGKPKSVEYREIPGVPPDCAVAFVRERVEVRNGEHVLEILTPGQALIVSPPPTQPHPGDLILVAKNIDWTADVEGGSDEGLAGVQLMRYVEADADGEKLLYGWPLDGSKTKRVQIDGPYSVAGVVIGRWSGRS